jgi:hypothetical protein
MSIDGVIPIEKVKYTSDQWVADGKPLLAQV